VAKLLLRSRLTDLEVTADYGHHSDMTGVMPMAARTPRRLYPGGLVAVFGVTVMYLVALFVTGRRLRDIENGRAEVTVLGLPVFDGERIGATTSASPGWGFAVLALVFVGAIGVAWIVSHRRRDRS